MGDAATWLTGVSVGLTLVALGFVFRELRALRIVVERLLVRDGVDEDRLKDHEQRIRQLERAEG